MTHTPLVVVSGRVDLYSRERGTTVEFPNAGSRTMADEEPVNPRPEIEEACRPQCVKPMLEYEKCATRIADDQTGEAHCTGQYFDMLECLDRCVAPKLFAKLK